MGTSGRGENGQGLEKEHKAYKERVSVRLEAMRAAAELLRKANVRSVPYINGRIFDMDSRSFTQDDKGASCARLPRDG